MMVYKIVKSVKDQCYDCFDENGNWVFTRAASDNVFEQLSKLPVNGIEYEDKSIMHREAMVNGGKRIDVVDRLLSLQGEQLEVWKTDNVTICVSYAHCDVKDGYFLISEFGSGTTFYDACEDYYKKICGKTLVFNAYTNHRKEVKVL